MVTAKPGLSLGKKLAIGFALILLFDALGLLYFGMRLKPYVVKTFGLPDEKRRQWDEEIARHPKDAEKYAGRAAMHQLYSETELALDDYNKAISLDTKHADWYYERGQVTSGASSIADYSKAIELDAKNSQYFLERAKEYASAKKEKEALADFQNALRLKCREPYVLAPRGQMYQACGELEKAKSDYQHYLEVCTDYDLDQFDVSERLAKIYIARGEYNKALSACSRRLPARDSGSTVDSYMLKAEIFQLLGGKDLADKQYNEALSDLNQSLTTSQSGFEFSQRGDLNLRLGKIASAKSDWQTAVSKLESDFQDGTYENTEIHRSVMGPIYEKLGDREKRDQCYRLDIKEIGEQIKADPDNGDNYALRAGVFDSLGDYPSALRDLRTAIRLDPESTDSYECGIAQILLKQNKVHAALQLLLKGAGKDDDAIVEAGLAQAYQLSGQHKEALAAADKAINLNGEFDDCYTWRAKACQSLGDKKGAALGFKIAEIFKND